MQVDIGDTAPEQMTLEALKAEFVALAGPFALLSNRRAALNVEIVKREQAAHARSRVDAMSDEEKAALRAALGAG